MSKLKLVLAGSILLIATAAGFAGADDDRGGRRGGMKEKFDANKDGELDDAERDAMRAERGKHRGDRRAKMVAKFDTNKDGSLDRSERTAMKQSMAGVKFKQLDANGDGVLSLEEFSKAKHGGGRHGKRH